MTLEPEREPARDWRHAPVALVGWAGFVWLWWDVLTTTTVAEVVRAGLLVAVLVLLVVPANLAWVAHNVSIFRRKGPRSGRPSATLDYASDWTGRRVDADLVAVRRGGLVDVDVVDGAKSMRVTDPTTTSPTPVGAPSRPSGVAA